MIQYLPIEESFIKGEGLYFILCIWVHGYKQGIGNRQGEGIGSELLAAAEADAQSRGATGMAAWGLWLPVWMKASWFKKHGYKVADREVISLLVWKAFTANAAKPHWIRQRKSVPLIKGKVAVHAFLNGWCPAQNEIYEHARRACEELGEPVVFIRYDTTDPEVFAEWGISDGIFIDGKSISHGPPISYEKMINKIMGRVKKHSKCSC